MIGRDRRNQGRGRVRRELGQVGAGSGRIRGRVGHCQKGAGSGRVRIPEGKGKIGMM